MALPTFQKLGAKLVTPTWLSSTGLQVMFPRLFDNDAHRASLPTLPASRFSVLYSSDHSSGTGYIGRADFNDIEGTWTDSGAAIHSNAAQRETPHPVYDAVNNRVNVYVHDTSSPVTNGSQATRLMTTTTLSSLTAGGYPFNYGHHTGYAQVWKDGSTWKALHVMIGGEFVGSGYSTGSDGETFTFQQFIAYAQSHVAGTGYAMGGDPFMFEWDGVTYMLSNLQRLPRFPTNPVTKLVAYPVDTTTWRPLGGYYTLIEAGAPGATDARLNNHNSIVNIDGTLYLLYDAQDGNGNAAIHVAKAAGGTATQTALSYGVRADGELTRAATLTTPVSWNATSADLPASVTKTVISGSDTSTYDVGVGYRLSATGSAHLWLAGTNTLNISDYETVEFELQGVRMTTTGDTALVSVGFCWGTSKSVEHDGVWVMWSSPTFGGGRLTVRDDSGRYFVSREKTFTIPYAADSAYAWTRGNARTLAVRCSNYGARVSVLVDGHVAYSRDISTTGMQWSVPVRPFVQTVAMPEFRFSAWTVKTWSV
jgi:hypothetical protein